MYHRLLVMLYLFTTFFFITLTDDATAQQTDVRNCLLLATLLQQETMLQTVADATTKQAISDDQLKSALLGRTQDTLTPRQQQIQNQAAAVASLRQSKIDGIKQLLKKYNCWDATTETRLQDEIAEFVDESAHPR